MQQQTLGIVAPVPKGEWTPLANYQKLNIVRRNGASYMATAANTDIQPGVDPGWESYWMLLNEDGQGEEGDQGPAGPGVPTGGLQGEVLVKSSNTNYDTDWVPQSQIAAGSAENDGDGNNIVATYETKSDATAKNTNLQNQITQNVQNIEQNAQIGSRNAKRLDGLEQRINPSPFVTDSTVAYQKDVPSNAVGAVELQAIGGMTYRDSATNTLKDSPVTAVKSVGANLIPFPYYEGNKTVSGLTLTVNADGSIHVAGTATSNIGLYLIYEGNSMRKPIKAGTYTASATGDPKVEFIVSISGSNSYNASYYNQKVTFTVSSDTTYYARLRILEGATVNTTVYPMLNRGSTALPYSPYTESPLPIPAAVQALDGYGQGNPDDPTEYNAIQWDRNGKCSYSHKGNITNDTWVPLATEVVTDISSLITSDNLLPVQGNGVLIFENANSQAVPSTVEFITAEATA